jgi:hypothetical protein
MRTSVPEVAKLAPVGRRMTSPFLLNGGLSMNDLDVTRNADDQEPVVAHARDGDDGTDPWVEWEDVGGEG